MGIGGLGIGDWGLGPIPNPQSPIPNPQSPTKIKKLCININHKIFKNKYIFIILIKYNKNLTIIKMFINNILFYFFFYFILNSFIFFLG